MTDEERFMEAAEGAKWAQQIGDKALEAAFVAIMEELHIQITQQARRKMQ